MDQYETLYGDVINYVDLTNEAEPDNPNSSIEALAGILYTRSIDSLDAEQMGLVTGGMPTVDMFCMFLELVLYGIDLLPKLRHEHLTLDLLLQQIQKYIASMGVDMLVEHVLIDPIDTYLYRERSDLFCEVLLKPDTNCLIFDPDCWSVGAYWIDTNAAFEFTDRTALDAFKAFTISTDQTVVTIINFRPRSIFANHFI